MGPSAPRTYSEVLRDSAVQCASMGAVTTASNSSSCNSSSSPGAKYGDHPLTPPVVGSSAQPHPGALNFRHETCFELEEGSSGGQEAASSASTVWAEPRGCQAFPALGLHEIRRPTRQPPSPPLPSLSPLGSVVPTPPQRLNLPRGLCTRGPDAPAPCLRGRPFLLPPPL